MTYPEKPSKRGRPTENKRERPARGAAEDEDRESPAEKLAALDAIMPGLGARRAALDVMMLLRRGRTMDIALNDTRTFNALEGADRSFAYNLVTTTMRQRGALDDIIGQYLERPLPERSMEVQDILRLASTQTLFLDTPAHAAVATAVELAGQKRETAGYKGLVNAIARKIGNTGKAKLEKLPLRANTPGWLWRSWERQFGAAVTRAIAEAHQKTAPLDLTFKPGADLATFTGFEDASSLAPNHLRLPGHHLVPELPGFSEGDWWVQDLAASLPVRLLGDVSGKSVLDLCAAPGGKTLQLAAAGAEVTAVDASGPRLKRVMENLARTKLEALTVKADILDWHPEEPADMILLDAPCSATGTVRRHPDVIWSKTEDEVRALAGDQSHYIDRAADMLKPGGLLVYCVCSLQRAESEDQAKAALSRRDDIELVPVEASELPDIPGIVTRDGYLRTLPSMMAEKGGMDGFFTCRFRKV